MYPSIVVVDQIDEKHYINLINSTNSRKQFKYQALYTDYLINQNQDHGNMISTETEFTDEEKIKEILINKNLYTSEKIRRVGKQLYH